MTARYHVRRRGNVVVAWNDDVLDEAPGDTLFDPQWWADRKAVVGEAIGRGSAYFLNARAVAGQAQSWVLRHNRRGGVLARLNRDRYLWTGASRIRALAELRLLAQMVDQGLPVPVPVAARGVRRGLIYRGDIIMRTVEQAEPLAEMLARRRLAPEDWHGLGATLGAFHRSGVWHGDLNARNILFDAQRVFHVIDFDKAGRRAPGRWQQANLERLRRSLAKFRRQQPGFNFAERDWRRLTAGYESVLAGSL